jgi:hypothetical protein
MVGLIPTNETLYNEFMDSIETIPFTDEEVSGLNEILADDDDITVQPINLEHVFNDETSDSNTEEEDDDESDSEGEDSDSDSEQEECEENLLEDVYFPTLTNCQLQDLAASAYHDTSPSELSALLDPIALDFDVTRDSIKHELICFHKDLNWD